MHKAIHRGALALGVVLGLYASTAQASLTVLRSFVGNYGVSTSGWGSLTQAGTLTAHVPAGATVKAAYLYTSAYRPFATDSTIGGTFESNAITYTPLGVNVSAGNLEAGRADVTSIVAPVINGGPGGAYNFSITENSSLQDGSALVVVYQLPSLPVSTVAVLDGFSESTGDSTALQFPTPINTAVPGFFAEMRLGIGFSCCGQASQVAVNGTVITQNAGNNDDSADANLNNGNLITVGGDNDPFSPMLPTYDEDHERYNLIPQITNGSTTIAVDTVNPSNNDNIFLAVFHVYGRAGVNGEPPAADTPQPVPLWSPVGMGVASSLLGVLGALGLGRRRRRGTAGH